MTTHRRCVRCLCLPHRSGASAVCCDSARHVTAGLLTALLIAGLYETAIATTPVLPAAQDTTVITATRPQAEATGRLVEQLVIGQDNGPPEYTLGTVASIAMGRNGSVYIVDNVSQSVSQFDARGRFVRRVGRAGDGPGEYRRPRAVTVAPDGSVLIVESAFDRIHRFDITGRWLRTIDTPPLMLATLGSSKPSPYFVADVNGVLWLPLDLRLVPMSERRSRFGVPFVRMSLDGAVIDTVMEPASPVRPERLSVVGPRADSYATRAVPFTPTFTIRVSPLGYLVTGLSSNHGGTYSIDLWRPRRTATGASTVWRPADGITSIRVPYEPARVQSGERADWTRTLTTSLELHSRPARWEWNAAPIPAMKAPYSTFLVGDDGRIWVSVHTPAVLNPAAPASMPRDASGDVSSLWPSERWPTPVMFDIIEPDGTLRGRVEAERNLHIHAVRGDTVWAVRIEDHMMLRAVKFQIEWR